MTFWEYLWAGSGTTKALYHLNGNSSDSSWNSNNGTATNITWVDGKFGQCASFNGSSSYITIPDSASLDITQWTIWVWLNFGSTQQDYPIALDKSASGTARNYVLWLAQHSWYWANRYKFYFNYYNWSSRIVYSNTLYTSLYNQRISVIATMSWGVASIYLNGVLDNSASIWVNLLANSWSLSIWRQAFSPATTYYNWLIDEIIIENIARTAQEIQKYYTYAKWKFWII